MTTPSHSGIYKFNIIQSHSTEYLVHLFVCSPYISYVYNVYMYLLEDAQEFTQVV